MNISDLKLYAVTDRKWLNGAKLSEHVKLALEGGATMIQIRDKDILSHEGGMITDGMIKEQEKEEALEIKRICHEYKAPLIINDNVQFAMEIDADGVHLGQDDMDPVQARKLLGPDKIIGVTAKTVEQAKRAQAQGADYLGVGAVFHTGTKSDATDLSRQSLKAICDAVDIPVIAIGGISADNVLELSGNGLCGIAVISAIFAQKDIEAAARYLSELTKKMITL